MTREAEPHESSEEDKANFPTANTCANAMSIPLISNYEVFTRNIVAAVNIKIKMFTTE